MSVLIRRFKLPTGMMKEERIDDLIALNGICSFLIEKVKPSLKLGKKSLSIRTNGNCLKINTLPVFSFPHLGILPGRLIRLQFSLGRK